MKQSNYIFYNIDKGKVTTHGVYGYSFSFKVVMKRSL